MRRWVCSRWRTEWALGRLRTLGAVEKVWSVAGKSAVGADRRAALARRWAVEGLHRQAGQIPPF